MTATGSSQFIPSPATDASKQPLRSRAVVAIVAISAIEFYEFVVYAFFTVQIGQAYFPSSTPWGTVLLAVAAFGVGFVTRPLGSIVIGAYADRAGRRAALQLSAGLMALGTLGMAVTPTYESIGIVAPVIVVCSRLVQGFALGGEVGPSTAFLVELAPPDARGWYASWQLASQGIAACLGGAVGVCLSLLLSSEQMQAWGWRVPLLLGLLIMPTLVYLRRNMPETLRDGTPLPVGRVTDHHRVLGLAVVIVMGATVSTYVGAFMTTYAMTTLKLPATAALSATLAVGVCTMVFALLGGRLSDRVGRTAVMFWPRAAAAVLTVPAFLALLAHPTPVMLVAVSGGMAALTAASGAASFTAIAELLPRHMRSTGSSIVYAVGVTVFGGTTQLIAAWLIGVTGDPVAPAWYVAGTSALAALAMLALPTAARG